jgi:hypothetical protein
MLNFKFIDEIRALNLRKFLPGVVFVFLFIPNILFGLNGSNWGTSDYGSSNWGTTDYGSSNWGTTDYSYDSGLDWGTTDYSFDSNWGTNDYSYTMYDEDAYESYFVDYYSNAEYWGNYNNLYYGYGPVFESGITYGSGPTWADTLSYRDGVRYKDSISYGDNIRYDETISHGDNIYYSDRIVYHPESVYRYPEQPVQAIRVSSRDAYIPEGQLANISSVYLDQVPYTGVGDILTVLGYISLIFIWSAIVAVVLLKRRQKNQISRRVKNFKLENKMKMISS